MRGLCLLNRVRTAVILPPECEIGSSDLSYLCSEKSEIRRGFCAMFSDLGSNASYLTGFASADSSRAWAGWGWVHSVAFPQRAGPFISIAVRKQ